MAKADVIMRQKWDNRDQSPDIGDLMTDPSTDTEYELYDEDDILDEDSDEEWQEGDCDHCSGYVPGPDDRSLTPACACKIGQGADEGDCECGDGS